MAIPHWVCIAEPAALVERLVAETEAVVTSRPAERPSWTLAIPGGSVAEQMLPGLAGARVPWDVAHVFWCDERAVAIADPQSNWAQAQALWAREQRVRGATLHRMPAEAPDQSAAMESYTHELELWAGRPVALDVVLLGVGEDGHVASLFPGRAALAERARVVVFESHAPKPPPRRMSLTLPTLASARLTCVAAFGAAKQESVRQALNPRSDLPVAQLLRDAHNPLLLVDAAAGAGLP